MRDCYAKLAIVLFLLAFAVSCGPLDDPISEDAANRQGFNNFQTAVASDRNYVIYWMGREFQAAGRTYRGPSVNDFGDEVEGGGLGVGYIAECGTGICSDVKLYMYSRTAWDLANARRAASQSPRSETKAVVINGRAAELRTIFGDFTPIGAQVVTIDFGDTVVEAITGAVLPSTAGEPQRNPLIDEAEFLAVMENLRRYPD